MSKIEIQISNIIALETDAIVNAANRGLRAGGGVCGTIFIMAGFKDLEKACDEIGHCDVGSAVITPGFRLKAKYIIHAVGPVWCGGNDGEAELLYGAYRRSLELAVENGCRSIGFPLLSAGSFGYPQEEAWRVALKACCDYLTENVHTDLTIVFAVISDRIWEMGQRVLKEIAPEMAKD